MQRGMLTCRHLAYSFRNPRPMDTFSDRWTNGPTELSFYHSFPLAFCTSPSLRPFLLSVMEGNHTRIRLEDILQFWTREVGKDVCWALAVIWSHWCSMG